jgi:hypothetical protein
LRPGENRFAKVEADVNLLKWMVGFLIALQPVSFGMLWRIDAHI